MSKLLLYLGIIFVVSYNPEGCSSSERNNIPTTYINKITSTTSPFDKSVSSSFEKNEKQALADQWKLLQRKRRGNKHYKLGEVSFNHDDLKQTVRQLENWNNAALIPFSEYFDTHKIEEKKKKKVLFTGYYSPIIKVKREADAEYCYPIYTLPKEDIQLPTRREIYQQNALVGQGLELAYSKSLLDIQTLHLQGSGYIEFQEDGKQMLLSYAGHNGHQRRSIQKYFLETYAPKGTGVNMNGIKEFIDTHPDKADDIIFHNPSFIFFNKSEEGKKVNGSGNVPLHANISIATDKRYIPTGACLWASRPSSPTVTAKKMSLMLAQDVGGGIKGSQHVDIYTGIGNEGRKGTQFKGYGDLWLILAKRKS